MNFFAKQASEFKGANQKLVERQYVIKYLLVSLQHVCWYIRNTFVDCCLGGFDRGRLENV